MTSPAIRQVAQHVEDLDRAVAFYRDVLGLTLLARFDPPGLAFFQAGDLRLLLEKGAPPALIYFGTPDVATATDALRDRGVTIESEPHVVFEDAEGTFGPGGESELLAFFRDSEGNLLGLSGRRPAGG
jgi:methylmalonyl-CoA/ethylmalonyl-CoA epimerase